MKKNILLICVLSLLWSCYDKVEYNPEEELYVDNLIITNKNLVLPSKSYSAEIKLIAADLEEIKITTSSTDTWYRYDTKNYSDYVQIDIFADENEEPVDRFMDFIVRYKDHTDTIKMLQSANSLQIEHEENKGVINATDIYIAPASGSCESPPQSMTYSFDKTFDRNLTTYYDSQWALNDVNNHKPSFEYTFDGTSKIDYIVYYGRALTSTGAVSGGTITAMDMYITTKADPEEKYMGQINPATNNSPKRFVLPKKYAREIITKIRFKIVNSKSGEVAFSEMEFYQVN